MKDFELFRRRSQVCWYKSLSLSFSELLFSLVQRSRHKLGVSKHVLEKVKVAFGLLRSAISPVGSGVKGPAVNPPPAVGGCEKGKVALWGLLFIQMLVLKQKGRK